MSNPTVIYEDNDLLVVNKPAGMIVNRADTTKGEQTLQDWVDEKYPISNIQYPIPPRVDERQDPAEKQYPSIEETFVARSGIVHRLDKETSGIILVAKNPAAFGALQKQFKERVVHKTYLALAHGKIVPEEGEINVPVGRLEYNRKRFGVVAGGRESITHYRVISHYVIARSETTKQSHHGDEFSLVELYPKTGRTHQIRVHLQYIHHPIFGDEFYAGRKVARADRKILPRVFLHAYKISFVHPTTNKQLNFQAKLPEELQEMLDKLHIVS